MGKLFIWENAEANGFTFNVTVYADDHGDARSLALGKIASLTPHTITEDEAKALVQWLTQAAPIIETNASVRRGKKLN